MRHRLLPIAFLLAAAPVFAQSKAADGHPDLQGVWTNATLTPMERPAEFSGKPTVTDAEAKAWAQRNLKVNDIDDPNAPLLAAAGSGSGDTAVGGYNNLFMDRGSQLARVDGANRTSLIMDPQDGRVPPLTDAAKARMQQARAAFAGNAGMGRFDSVKDRPVAERCIIGYGSTAGPPMMPVLYNNNYQIVQTPDTVMILVEMNHDARTVRINGKHPPADIDFWLGDSIGRWEGDTLVVDTTNFRPEARFRGTSENLHVIERFRRVDANTILYKATIDDPSTFSKPWTMEFPFVAAAGPIYEYACHEGNYAMTDILGGARKLEKQAGEK
jgi:hypothetical protein